MRVISPPPLIPDIALSTADDLRQGGGGIAVCGDSGMDGELKFCCAMLLSELARDFVDCYCGGLSISLTWFLDYVFYMSLRAKACEMVAYYAKTNIACHYGVLRDSV